MPVKLKHQSLLRQTLKTIYSRENIQVMRNISQTKTEFKMKNTKNSIFYMWEKKDKLQVGKTETFQVDHD